MEEENYIYPLTIVNDRYGGTYSGATFTAWNLDFWQIPIEIDKGDVDCWNWWRDKSGDYVIGKGATVEEAYKDLEKKLNTIKEHSKELENL